MHQLLGELAGFVALLALIPYVRSILAGKTKPNRASWLIWGCLAWLILISYHFSGATTTIWLAATYAVLPVIVFALSIKYGVGGYTRLDTICLIGAACGLILWKLTSQPETALYINLFIDLLGFLPTIKKTYLKPETENVTAWMIAVAADLLGVLALTTWQLQVALYPIYLLLLNVIVAVLATGKVQKYQK